MAISAGLKKYVKDANSDFFEVKELEDIGFDGTHKIKVRSKYNGTTRTIDLSDTGQIRPYYDVNDKISNNIFNCKLIDNSGIIISKPVFF